ncbi:hypothetical protein [Actinomadura sp. WMMB 499]|uniref:hypothetical protein n=1 Tax=Actinomadura sp. WMMB 499 TaxID=1219491 RepID=UPI001246389A|nr:hypothetical protein [Actinomadura sp. WMMB 499]QFG24611.1 hypothetical protein F7P10_29200 [Actinomadura sp. WMMB 499]
MVDWNKWAGIATDVLTTTAFAVVVENWLKMDDTTAYHAIREYVTTKPTAELDRMDAVLAELAANTVNRERAARLVRFYAMLKVAETVYYDEFRGFPA